MPLASVVVHCYKSGCIFVLGKPPERPQRFAETFEICPYK